MTAWSTPDGSSPSDDGASREAGGPRRDMRLVGLAAGTWLSALAALYLAPVTAIGVAAGTAVLAVTYALWAWRRRPRHRQIGRVQDHRYTVRQGAVILMPVVVAVLLGGVVGAAATAARTVHRDAAPVADLARERAVVTAGLVIKEDPRQARTSRAGARLWVVVATLRWLRPGTAEAAAPGATVTRLNVRVVVLTTAQQWHGLLPGQRVQAEGWLSPSRRGDLTAAVLMVRGPPERVEDPPVIQQVAGRLRAGLRAACMPLPNEVGGLLPGLVVGDTSRLDPMVAADFYDAGLTHLTAVSGANLALVSGFVLFLARWCRAGPRWAAGLALLAVVGFVILARPSPSVLRAAVMAGIALLALAFGRPRAAMPALATAVFLLVVIDPGLAADPGFALSVLATAALLVIAPWWRDRLQRYGVRHRLADAVAVPAAAQVACAPLIAGMAGTVSLVAVPANMLTAPAVAPATLLGVAAAALSPVWPTGAEAIAWLAAWPAWWLVIVAREAAAVPGGVLPWPAGIAGATLLCVLLTALCLLMRRPGGRRMLALLILAALVGETVIRCGVGRWPPPHWVAVACDVGQGDTVVLAAGPGQGVVIDAGPDPVLADRCLTRLGIRDVPWWIISHYHADHVAGAPGVFRYGRVGTVLTGAYLEPEESHRSVATLAARHGVPVRRIHAGWRGRVGPLQLEVLGPITPLRGTRSDPNNNSLILRATIAGVRLLLPGDAETEQQRALLEAGTPVRADILKVPHHGSAYQDREFLAAVDPAVAVVLVGADNDYGHPSPTLLAQLRASGTRVWRTDLHGDIAIVVDEGEIRVVTHRVRRLR